MTFYYKVEYVRLSSGIFIIQQSYALQFLKFFGIKNYTLITSI